MRRPRRHRHGPPRHWAGWMLARGLHRRVSAVIMVALVVGGLGGAAVHAAIGRGVTTGTLIGAALAALFVLGPGAWIATFQIAKPLRQLVVVAQELHAGRLGSRGELPDAPGEVGEVAGALRSLADRLERQLREQRSLMATVSHELRSPLGRARVLVEMGREGTAPPSLFDDLDAEIAAMDDLVGDLLAGARIDFEAVSPRSLDVADVLARAAEVGGLPADAVRDDAGGRVLADATLVQRALLGLVDNGRRYGGARVTLRAVDLGDRVRFEVDDDGPGFPPGEEERAFEPFWRAPAVDGRPSPRGEGLGLALVRRIAEAHGGAAGAERPAGGGARVWVELPRG